MSESAEKPCDSLALLGDYDYDEKEASPEASEPAHMGINEKTDIEVARASSAEADSEQPGSPVSGPDHSSILLDEKKSDDESKVKSIREDEPMETSSAYRGGPCLSEDSSDDDSDDEDDIRKSPVDRKQNQSPKQELEDEATSAVDINSKLESPKTMDETVGMNYEKVKSDSPEESLDCDYGEKPKSSPLEQPTSPKIDKLMECNSAEKPEKPSSSEPVVQEKPIDPENFDGLLVMSGEDSSSPKQLDDNSVDMPKSHERSKSPEQSKKPLEQPNENLLTVMGQLNLTTDDSEKGSPSLSDMPVDVIALIIERSDYKQQLILRKVSKSLRALVDKLKPACESICFMYFKNSINLVFDEQWVMYSKDVFEGPSEDIAVARDDFEKAAFDDLVSTLKNPRLQLEYFHNVLLCEVVFY
ncbi:hypothetical protein CAEBREN_14675 [Caenorhabditis brenneri]|uniref:F-box domain-containing protein n=1 Tax=Caenorhabditis brenneri TaxID=135651 RepID=G0ND64_CAEBE|nr:hypothetical protein CAEBREN_14675 [Caenorhabditis brenneri]